MLIAECGFDAGNSQYSHSKISILYGRRHKGKLLVVDWPIAGLGQINRH
jgi:hypothetical protein